MNCGVITKNQLTIRPAKAKYRMSRTADRTISHHPIAARPTVGRSRSHHRMSPFLAGRDRCKRLSFTAAKFVVLGVFASLRTRTGVLAPYGQVPALRAVPNCGR